jgi:hypothetical protein
MIERLPQFAERYFASLCASAGVICNGSEEDECGWDFFLQFPTQTVQEIPADKQPANLEALVQVKSTKKYPLVVRMKLSNALRLARANQPCFVILILDDVDGPRTYAKHFWHNEIQRTLRRVRIAERDGGKELHKRHVEIRMYEDDKHSNPLDWMKNTIADVKPSYVEEKLKIVNTVGHEDGYGSMTMSIVGTSDDFLNLQLGITDSLPVARAKYVPQRFGIEAARPEFEIEDAELFVTPVSKPVVLRLQCGNPTEVLTVNANLYGAEIPTSYSKLTKLRLVAGPLNVIMSNGVAEVKLNLNGRSRLKLAELKVFLTLRNWNGSGAIGLQLIFDDQCLSFGSLEFDKPHETMDWQPFIASTTALDIVVQVAHSSEPEISILDLYNAGPWLQRFAVFVTSPVFRIVYDPIEIYDPVRAILYYAGCDVGEFCFLAVIERNTQSDEMNGAKRHLTFGPPLLLEAIVRKGSWVNYRDEIAVAYNRQIKRIGKPETLWEIGDLEEFIKKASCEDV